MNEGVRHEGDAGSAEWAANNSYSELVVKGNDLRTWTTIAKGYYSIPFYQWKRVRE